MADKFVKVNSQYGIIDYPVTLDEMEGILKEFPKTERKFYEFAVKALRKAMDKKEKIYAFENANPKLTKNGFIVIGEKNLYLVSLKGGLLGGAEAETIKYKSIKEVDFDIITGPLGINLINTGILYLKVKSGLGTKKRTIRNVEDNKLDALVSSIRERI